LERGVRPIGDWSMSMTLSRCSSPRCGRAGRVLARAVELARDGLVERVDQQRRLAAAGDAGDAGEQAERDLGGDVLQVVAARADDLERRAGFCGARARRHRDLRAPVRYWPVSELRVRP
jgi:hypothetical protein